MSRRDYPIRYAAAPEDTRWRGTSGEALLTPCFDDPSPYDVLNTTTRGSTPFERARLEAIKMCHICPIRETCLSLNAGEPWAGAVVDTSPPPRWRTTCGSRSGYLSHARRGERPCAGCLRAERDYTKARRARKRRAA